MLRKLLALTIVAALGVMLAAATTAQQPRERQQRTEMGRPAAIGPSAALRIPSSLALQQMRAQLALTEDQGARVEALALSAQERARPLVEAQRNSMQAVLKAIAEPGANKAAVDTAIAAAARSETAVLSSQAAFWLDLKGLLTAEQNTRLGEMLLRPAPRPIGPPPGGVAPGPGPGPIGPPPDTMPPAP